MSPAIDIMVILLIRIFSSHSYPLNTRHDTVCMTAYFGKCVNFNESCQTGYDFWMYGPCGYYEICCLPNSLIQQLSNLTTKDQHTTRPQPTSTPVPVKHQTTDHTTPLPEKNHAVTTDPTTSVPKKQHAVTTNPTTQVPEKNQTVNTNPTSPVPVKNQTVTADPTPPVPVKHHAVTTDPITPVPVKNHTMTTDPSSCGVSLVNYNHRIVGGLRALPGQYPWQVSLLFHDVHVCGGALIDSQWIITAAHCVEKSQLIDWKIGVGYTNQNSKWTSHLYAPSKMCMHRNYDEESNSYDIAMMKLSKPVDASGKYVRSVCLPSEDDEFVEATCTVTGWGSKYSGGQTSGYLRGVNVPVVSNRQCSDLMGASAIFPHNICAGYMEGGRDACKGDSGGPLVCKRDGVWKLAGIVSWGYGCAEEYTPGVYTKVSSFLDWIDVIKHHEHVCYERNS